MEEKYDHWLYYGKGYLKLAGLCCQQLLDSKHNWSDKNPHVPDQWVEGYYGQDLVPGIFYNAKHGIELFLKRLLINLEAPNKKDHDLGALFRKAKSIIEEIDWQPITKKEGGDIIRGEEIDRLKEAVINETEELIWYFYTNKILEEKLKIQAKPDKDNIIFKYPETKSGEHCYSLELYEKLDKKDIEEILSKITTLYRHFCDVGYLIAVDRRYQPRKK